MYNTLTVKGGQLCGKPGEFSPADKIERVMSEHRSRDLVYKLAFFVLVGAALALVAFSARPLRTVHHSIKGIATADIKVLGTSNLHSWSMEDKDVSCSARFTYVADKAIPATVASVTFTFPVHGLTSGRSGMDSKAFDAMKAKDGGNISFTATASAITPVTGNSFEVKSDGNLTIAGVTRAVVLRAACEVKSDGVIACTGTDALKMSDYQIKPPTYMLGALRTGNTLKIAFSMEVMK